MPQPHRLRKHADYQHAYPLSRRKNSTHFAYFLSLRPPERRSETPGPRIGLTVPKALGKAHDRNRIKRRCRALIRTHLALLTVPADLILHPRRSVLTAPFADLSRDLATIFRIAQKSLALPPTPKPLPSPPSPLPVPPSS